MEAGPQVATEKWYPVTLGSTLAGTSNDRLYTMRYDFKPASVKSSTSGSINITGDNEVTMEFHPPATGKPNFVFQGKAEPCKELDAVLFFDGKKFTIEKLARSIKSLRHIPQQSGGGVATSGVMSSGAERQGGAAVETEKIEPEREGDGGARNDEEQGEKEGMGRKGAKRGGKGPGSQKHLLQRPSAKRKPDAVDVPEPQPSKPKKPAEKEESSPEEEPAATEVEQVDEEEVVEEIIYEEEEARPAAPPPAKAPPAAKKSGLVESSSDSGHSSGSGSDDDSDDDDDDDEDDDDDDGDDDGSSGSDDDS